MTPTVFVYGTLTDHDRAGAVLDEFAFRDEATLAGLHRVDGEYPTLAPGGRVSGRLLDTPYLDALDSYEGVERGLYCRIEVPLVADETAEQAAETTEQVEETTCWTYVGDPDRLGAGSQVSWPGDGPFPDRVRDHVRNEAVVVRRD
jgi:gamma-glutamylaminecyclotransferase